MIFSIKTISQFHNALLQAVCDLKGLFKIYVQNNMVEYMMLLNLHGLKFYRSLEEKILPEAIFVIIGIEIWPYLLVNFSYSNRPYLLKFFKISFIDPKFNDKKIFNEYVNSEKVVIEHVFEAPTN